MENKAMHGMERWLRNYEAQRHSKNPIERNEQWHSSKYPIESMHWQELQKLYLPEIGLNWGQACSSLKKLWKSCGFESLSELLSESRD